METLVVSELTYLLPNIKDSLAIINYLWKENILFNHLSVAQSGKPNNNKKLAWKKTTANYFCSAAKKIALMEAPGVKLDLKTSLSLI